MLDYFYWLVRIETLYDINMMTLSPKVRLCYIIHGILIVSVTIIAWAGTYIYGFVYFQFVADIYYMVTLMIVFCFLFYCKVRIMVIIKKLAIENFNGPTHQKQMQSLTLQILMVFFIAILGSIFYSYRITLTSHGIVTGLQGDELSIFSGFLTEIIGVLITLWYGWVPVNGPQKQLSHSPVMYNSSNRVKSSVKELEDPNEISARDASGTEKGESTSKDCSMYSLEMVAVSSPLPASMISWSSSSSEISLG